MAFRKCLTSPVSTLRRKHNIFRQISENDRLKRAFSEARSQEELGLNFENDAIAQSDPGNCPNITNLDLSRPEFKNHRAKDNWVVFSDLHCKASNVETCLEVLDFIKTVASKRFAGVAFLGDFWDVRYILRVEVLNKIMQELSTWDEIPVVMIPGNHDMVDLNGREHSLSVLKYAFPSPDQAVILHTPTIFMNALWIPNIENEKLDLLLRSFDLESVNGCFIHAEIKNAVYNYNQLSRNGLSIDLFNGKNVNVYSGHLHKPQKMAPQIHYVGSPYQVTLAEAGQEKSLLLLESGSWQIMEKIAICIGNKHFKVESIEEALALDSLRPGDRIVWQRTLEDETCSDQTIEDIISTLRSKGVHVEVREAPVTNIERNILDSNMELLPRFLFENYIQDCIHTRGLEEQTVNAMRQIGEQILQEAFGEDISPRMEKKSLLQFDTVQIEGFGVYKTSQTYKFGERGLVLLKGSSSSNERRSNATGKSTLAFAPLWALTGYLDSRPFAQSDVSAVINTDSTACEVMLTGKHGNNTFEIKRSRYRTGPKSIALEFRYNGQDMTMQSVAETQRTIESILGTTHQILSRTVFYGQHSGQKLLEATDTEFKREISALTRGDKWQTAAVICRQERRELEREVSNKEGKKSAKKEALDRFKAQLNELTERLQEQSCVVSNSDRSETLSEKPTKVAQMTERIEFLEKKKEHIMNRYSTDKFDKKIQRNELQLKEMQGEISKVTAELNQINEQRKEEERRVQEIKEILHRSQYELEEIQICPTCKQRLPEDNSGFRRNAVDELEKLRSYYRIAQGKLFNYRSERAIRLQLLDKYKEAMLDTTAEIHSLKQQATEIWKKRENHLLEIEELLRQVKMQHREYVNSMSSLALKIKKSVEIEAAKNHHLREISRIKNDINSENEQLKSLETEIAFMKKRSKMLEDLSVAFQKDLQLAAVRNIMHELCKVTQNYLDILSTGRLKLHLNLVDDKITKQVQEILDDNRCVNLTMASLSGGQWRRCSLAFALGFAELVSKCTNFTSTLLVLDEPMTHLDSAGKANVSEVLQQLLANNSYRTILVVLQDFYELEGSFDSVDNVTKLEDGSAIVSMES